MKAFQIGILVGLLIRFMGLVHGSYCGQEAKEPVGFPGLVFDCVWFVLALWVYSGAGAFSKLF